MRIAIETKGKLPLVYIFIQYFATTFAEVCNDSKLPGALQALFMGTQSTICDSQQAKQAPAAPLLAYTALKES